MHLLTRYEQLLGGGQEAQGTADLQADSCAQIKQVLQMQACLDVYAQPTLSRLAYRRAAACSAGMGTICPSSAQCLVTNAEEILLALQQGVRQLARPV